MTEIRRIAITTGGGDAPGLNAVIHAVVYAATGLGANHLAARYAQSTEGRRSVSGKGWPRRIMSSGI